MADVGMGIVDSEGGGGALALILEQEHVPSCSEKGNHDELPVEESQSVSVEVNGLGEDKALQDVGNMVCDPRPVLPLPKKSLLKRPKSPSSDSSNLANPPKRIRIVENVEDSPEDEDESVEGADDLATVTEEISCGETLKWLNSPSCSIDQESVNVDFVRATLVPVKRTFSVEIDMRFILTETCTAILGCKTRIAEVGSTEFHIRTLRRRSSELKGILYQENFLKMANIDAVLNYDLTSPQELTEDNIYYIGDLWQTSKGFREYLLLKTSQKEEEFSTKILSMRTLGPFSTESEINRKTGILFPEIPSQQPDNVDLAHLSTENVEPFGSFSEYHNILDGANIDKFTNFVLSRTKGKGLHTFVVDNAEVSNVYESCREIRLQKYFYAECLLALRCLRAGGTFICKIFDTFTLFTNGLLFLLYKCFKHIAIHKPSSSPSCTSERFVICKDKIDNADSKYVIDFLTDCLDMVVNNQEQRKIVRRRVRKRLTVVKMEVQKIVPLRLILSHAEFFQFVRESNIRLSTTLATSIVDLCGLIRQKNLPQLITSQMLTSWSVPSKEQVEAFCLKNGVTINAIQDLQFEADDLSQISFVQKEFHAFPIRLPSTGDIFPSIQGWFFGCGGSTILHRNDKTWTLVNSTAQFSLPYGTLVFGEITEQVRVEGKVKKFVPCFHIMDGVFVRGSFIGGSPFPTRQAILSRLISTLESEGCNKNISIIPSVALNRLTEFYLSTQYLDLLGCGKIVRHTTADDNTLTLVNGYLIAKNIQDTSPQNFFSKSEWRKLIWDQDEEGIKSNLLKIESRLSL